MAVASFRDIPYRSEEMRHLLMLDEPEVRITKALNNIKYVPENLFPEWLLKDSDWKNTTAKSVDTSISEILKTPLSQRTPEQISVITHWLMDVWAIANTMGYKRCNKMLQAFKFFEYKAGDNIIVEGERGLTFYIIIKGECAVYKEGIGCVANLGKGKSFGEIALTQGNDLRTATIRANTKVEVLTLHKLDYDTFVKDFQQAERRENFHLFRECELFRDWSRNKVEKMANTCNRKIYNAGDKIFQQGDTPDDLFIVFEGTVRIIKNVLIENRNRWPTGPNSWGESLKRTVKPYLVQIVEKGGHFGELSIMKQCPRNVTAEAETKCILLAIDKLEFLHYLNMSTVDLDAQVKAENLENDKLLKTVSGVIQGGPSSKAMIGDSSTLKPLSPLTFKVKEKYKCFYDVDAEHKKHVKLAEERLESLKLSQPLPNVSSTGSPSRPGSRAESPSHSPRRQSVRKINNTLSEIKKSESVMDHLNVILHGSESLKSLTTKRSSTIGEMGISNKPFQQSDYDDTANISLADMRTLWQLRSFERLPENNLLRRRNIQTGGSLHFMQNSTRRRVVNRQNVLVKQQTEHVEQTQAKTEENHNYSFDNDDSSSSSSDDTRKRRRRRRQKKRESKAEVEDAGYSDDESNFSNNSLINEFGPGSFGKSPGKGKKKSSLAKNKGGNVKSNAKLTYRDVMG